MRAGMALDDWISSLQWPLQNWPSCPPAIIRGSSNNLTLLNSEQFAWSSNLLTELRHQIDDKRQRCGRGFPFPVVSDKFIQIFTQLPLRRNCFPGACCEQGNGRTKSTILVFDLISLQGARWEGYEWKQRLLSASGWPEAETHFTLVTLKVAKLLTSFETKSLSTFKQQRQKLLSSHSCLKIHFLLLLPMVNRVWWEFGKSVSVNLEAN